MPFWKMLAKSLRGECGTWLSEKASESAVIMQWYAGLGYDIELTALGFLSKKINHCGKQHYSDRRWHTLIVHLVCLWAAKLAVQRWHSELCQRWEPKFLLSYYYCSDDDDGHDDDDDDDDSNDTFYNEYHPKF